MNVVMVCGLCITACVLCKVVEKNTKEISVVISILAVVIVMTALIGKISQINEVITELFLKADIDKEYCDILFKSAGICYITHMGAEVCKDCGETSISFAVELFGKISILTLTLPIIKALVVIIEGILYKA